MSIFKQWVRDKRADLLVLGLFGLVSCLFWWPIPIYFRTHQIEWPPIDPLFNQWILGWGAHSITHYPWRFFEANMFYPFSHTLAWGDHLFSLTIFAIPLIPLFGLVGAYNIFILSSSAFSAFTAYLLANYIVKNRPAAIVAGMMFGFTYFRVIESGHLQILWTQWIPLVFLFAEKLRVEKNKRDLWWFMLVVFLMLATNLYLAIFTTLAFAVYLFLLIIFRQITFSSFKKIILGWIVGGIAALPLYLPSIILQLRNPLVRGYFNQTSVYLNGLLPWPWPGRVLRKILELIGYKQHAPTYHSIGALTYPIMVAGLVLLWFKRRDRNFWIIVTFLIVAIVALLAAAGPQLYWKEITLAKRNLFYSIPYHLVPGYEALRNPMRWFFLVIMGLGIFVAWTLSHLFKRLPSKVVIVFVGLFITWMLLEQSPAPVNTFATYKIADYPVYQWLTKQPGEFAILELPIFPGVAVRGNDIIEGRRMYFSTWHWKKRVGGAITPYIPDEYVSNAKVLNAIGDDPKAIEMLIEWKVKYIIFQPDDFRELGWSDELRDNVQQRLDKMPQIELIQQFNNATVYHIKGQ